MKNRVFFLMLVNRWQKEEQKTADKWTEIVHRFTVKRIVFGNDLSVFWVIISEIAADTA
jgi:hypothetical protein